MNINFRAGYGNYQLSKPKQKEVPTEDTQLTNAGANKPDAPEMDTVTTTTIIIGHEVNGEWCLFRVTVDTTLYDSTGPSNHELVSPQAAELLKMNTMNFRQI